jgi:esterase/lipase superfamily enzyme
MADNVNVLFATNRLPAANANGVADFGSDIQPATPQGLICATATVNGIDIDAPSSGTIAAISALNHGGFAAADLAPLLQSTNDILVFIHGCANSFSDAVKRGAYNKTWLQAANLPGQSSNFDVIVFTWPARSYFIANIAGDYADYRWDQEAATQSAYHLGYFMQLLHELQQQIGPRRGLNLLCHSMGNYALGWALDAWFKQVQPPLPPAFQQIVLAAADETSTTFSPPNGQRLSWLRNFSQSITVYFNNNDIAMDLSHIANQDYRLGYNGPPNSGDTLYFPTNIYDFVDCTGVNDFISPWIDQPDRSHQYYRQSPTVRRDLVAVLSGFTPKRPAYNPNSNVYSLFPPQPAAMA